MHNLLKSTILLVCSAAIVGCNSGSGTAEKQPAKPAVVTAVTQESNVAASDFLKALQDGARVRLFEASRLDGKLVEGSRLKLTNVKKYPLTPEQRIEAEHPLRISGSIAFYIKKITPLLKGAEIKISDSVRTLPPRSPMILHTVTVSYKDKKDAPVDAGGKLVKEFTLQLQQIDRKTEGKEMLEFLIDNEEFIKIMDRHYEVKKHF